MNLSVSLGILVAVVFAGLGTAKLLALTPMRRPRHRGRLLGRRLSGHRGAGAGRRHRRRRGRRGAAARPPRCRRPAGTARRRPRHPRPQRRRPPQVRARARLRSPRRRLPRRADRSNGMSTTAVPGRHRRRRPDRTDRCHPCSASTACRACCSSGGKGSPAAPRRHLDDEIYRILARLGVGEDFAAVSRPCQGLRLLDRNHGVLAEFRRDIAGASTVFRRRTCSTSRNWRIFFAPTCSGSTASRCAAASR